MLDPLAVEHARFGFDSAHPERSAKRPVRGTQVLAAAALALVFAIAAAKTPTLTFGAFHVAALSFFAATILWRLVAAASAGRSEASLEQVRAERKHHLRVDGGAGREAAGGGARADYEEGASGGSGGKSNGPHPLSRAHARQLPYRGRAGRRFDVAPRRYTLTTLSQWPTYTILCPLYREANVVAELVAALGRIDYPTEKLDVKLLVEGDDPATIAAACLAAANAPRIEVVVVPPATPRTKPKALNAGLARARGDYLAVFDAEDRPHPQQLRAALAAFDAGHRTLACVQAPLAIENSEDSWIARQFAAEYAIQFTQALPLLARLGMPLPLGGTSNHFRTEALRAVGGWDPFNVTEDADLGYRLARDGYCCGVIAPPTWEEAPIAFRAWFKQRTRWLKGHMQTWLVLMRNPAQCARQMGWRAFASMQLILGGGIAAALVHAPLAFVLLAAALSPQDLLSPTDYALALFGYGVAMFAALAANSNGQSHARAALTMPLYWPLSSLAAYWALFELLFRPHYWSKTEHGLSVRTHHPIAASSAPIARTSASL